MWNKIRVGVRFNLREKTALAARGLDLSGVKSIKVSMDPAHADNQPLREFWAAVSAPRVRFTNQTVRIQHELRNDGAEPFFEAQLADGRKLVFRTAGMRTSDVIMRFNRLLGLPEIGKAGLRPLLQ